MSTRRAPSFLELRDEALKRFSQGPLPSLVVLAGEEAHVKERLVEAACATAGRHETFAARPGEADGAAWRRLLDTWSTPLLFGSAGLIVARGVDKLVAHGRLAQLEERLAGTPPPQSLLLTLSALDGRTRLAKQVRETGGLVSLPPLRDSAPPWHTGGPFLETDLNLWIRDEARRLGLALDLTTADELARRVGNEPAALAQRLLQLQVLLSGRTELRREDVQQHVRRSSARLLASWEEALREGNLREAVDLLDRMLAEGVHDHVGRLVSGPEAVDTLLRGLATQYARLLEAHEVLGDLRDALERKPWQRSEEETEALNAALGAGGRRVFLERDLRTTRVTGVRAAFRVALAGLRDLRDGRGLSMHATTVRLVAALGQGCAPERARVAPAARGSARRDGWGRP